MIVRNMIFEAEIIEQRRFPSFQTPHQGGFLPRLFLRGNHRRQIKTTIFSASASALCTDVVLFCNGTFSPTFKNFGEKSRGAEEAFLGFRFGWPKRVKGATLRPSLDPQHLEPAPHSDDAQAADRGGGKKPISLTSLRSAR